MKKTVMSSRAQLHPLHFPLAILLIEYVFMVYSGVGYDGLFKPVLYTYGSDPFYWLIFFLGIPEIVFKNVFVVYSLTYLPFILIPLCIGQFKPRLLSFFLLLFFVIYYIILTSVVGHHNFQIGIFLSIIPLLCKQENQSEAVRWIKYWIFFFYLSAAFLKLTSPSFFQSEHFAKMLEGQFIPYRLEHSSDIRLIINDWLMNHIQYAQFLYYLGFLTEFICVIGFFTQKFDNYLGIGLILFHLLTWILMDIAPIGQISLISYLFIRTLDINKSHINKIHIK